jgi:SAM-dependent methyltransferase
MSQKTIDQEWEEHWNELDTSFFGKLLKIFRIHVLAHAVRHYHEKYFPHEGIFLEAGSGTSQTSMRLKTHQRTYVAVDVSERALQEARKIKTMHEFVKADIRKLPYKTSSVSGIWNLGVMEHFSHEEIVKMLQEFRRVLKPGARAVLFWPYRYAPYQLLLKTISAAGRVFGKNIQFFPNEPSQLNSRNEAKMLARRAGFSSTIVHYNPLDLYCHMVVVCKK